MWEHAALIALKPKGLGGFQRQTMLGRVDFVVATRLAMMRPQSRSWRWLHPTVCWMRLNGNWSKISAAYTAFCRLKTIWTAAVGRSILRTPIKLQQSTWKLQPTVVGIGPGEAAEDARRLRLYWPQSWLWPHLPEVASKPASGYPGWFAVGRVVGHGIKWIIKALLHLAAAVASIGCHRIPLSNGWETWALVAQLVDLSC